MNNERTTRTTAQGKGHQDIPFRGRGTFGGGVHRQITSRLAEVGRGPAVLGVLRPRFSSFGLLASSVLMEAARFLVMAPRGMSLTEAEAWAVGGGGGRGVPDADKGAAVGEVSDPCCLAPAGAAAPAGLAAMTERVRGALKEEACAGCAVLASTTSVIFLGLLQVQAFGGQTETVEVERNQSQSQSQSHAANLVVQWGWEPDLCVSHLHKEGTAMRKKKRRLAKKERGEKRWACSKSRPRINQEAWTDLFGLSSFVSYPSHPAILLHRPGQ